MINLKHSSDVYILNNTSLNIRDCDDVLFGLTQSYTTTKIVYSDRILVTLKKKYYYKYSLVVF